MKEFNPIHTPIEPGLTLLEASAGTGKTYSLVRIIVRELVEKQISPDAIITVTFTRAATAEIKARLHGLITEVLTHLQHPPEKDINDLAEHWITLGDEFVLQARESLALALAQFDSIPIFTIDGFFQRLLKEYAFESQALFTIELEPDESLAIQTAIQDYWRDHVYHLNSANLKLFCANINQGTATKFILDTLSNPDAHLAADYAVDASILTESYQQAWKKFTVELGQHAEELIQFVESPLPNFSGSKKPFNTAGRSKIADEVQSVLSSPQAPVSIDYLEALRASNFESGALFKKGKEIALGELDLAPLFHAIEELCQAMPQGLKSAYLGDVYRYVMPRISHIKAASGVQSYSDVTSTLNKLLAGESSSASAMKRAVHQRYHAALIDEFQDTSPQQCAVFLALFHQQLPESDGRYFHIIGDPKQSIYRFRGADVFAYLKAAEEADQKYNLLTNYRSAPSMIHGVNELFSLANDPFLTNGAISFSSSKWPDANTPPAPPAASLQILTAKGNRKADSIQHHICSEIRSLLDQPWSSVTELDKDGDIKPKDIAILVRGKHEANSLHRLLSESGIPATIGTRTSLLDSDEANEVLTILEAVCYFRKPPLTRRALLMPTLGSGRELADTDNALAVTYHFAELHNIWLLKGVLPMMQECMKLFNSRATLLNLEQGQRKLTNVLHLIELLDAKSRSDRLTPLSTIQWLTQAIEGTIKDIDAEALELRIATDKAAVQILTQHTSKGLEYPIVFVTPPAKEKIKADKLAHHYHNTAGEAVFAPYDADDESYDLRVAEDMADNIRLAYVALTRAKYRCYFYYYPPSDSKDDGSTNAIYQMLGMQSVEELYNLAARSKGCIHVEETPSTNERPEVPYYDSRDSSEPQLELSARPTSRIQVAMTKRTSSFTGITRNAPEVRHDIDSNITDEGETIDFAEAGFWKELQAGASLGLVFHEVLEEIDFQDLSTAKGLITNKLEKYAPWRDQPSPQKLEWLTHEIYLNIEQLMNHELSTNLKLKQIPTSRRLNEISFLLTSEQFSLQSLSEILQIDPPVGVPDYYVEQLRTLDHHSYHHFLDGIIDLVYEHEGKYYILDWKTNQIDSADTAGLAEVMAHHHYFLQYHLYSLALDSLLRQRLGDSYIPSEHFGGVQYIFLRAVNPEHPGSGVYSDGFSPDRLARLRQLLHTQPLTTV